MANIYKHGVYGESVPSDIQSQLSLGTVPVYIGTLPTHRFNATGQSSFDYSQYINKPILVNAYPDIEALYSDNWTAYTLGEVISAHFLNENEAIAPFILINMLNPTTLASSPTETTINLVQEGANKVGYIEDDLCAIENVTVTATGETPLTTGNYTMEYEGDKVKLTITLATYAENDVTVSYKKIEPQEITETEFGKALDALDLCENITGYIPNILTAPSFSEVPDLHTLMVQKALEKIALKWYLTIVSDIPSTTGQTLETAKTWKSTNGYNSKFDKLCFPMQTYKGKIYHLSTLTTFTYQKQDLNNDDVPYTSPSNKVIYSEGNCLEDGTPVYITEYQANGLNEVGITTTNVVKRQMRLWGPHMANYDWNAVMADTIKPEDRTDASIRMMVYLLNTLQYNYLDDVDEPFSRRDIDSIIARVQTWLNSLVNEGKLLYATITFEEASNSTGDMINGDFVFDVGTTYAPIAKSLTFRLKYTTDGLSSLTGGAE